MTNHVVPPRVYLAVFAALLVLTATTTAVAFVDLGVMNVVVMLAIAIVKAVLVVLFFMHVRYSPRQLSAGASATRFCTLAACRHLRRERARSCLLNGQTAISPCLE
jgi:cytochrome c oxidase subunit 4